MWWTSGSNGPKPACWRALLLVRLTAPVVRPWNAPRKAMIAVRRVA